MGIFWKFQKIPAFLKEDCKKIPAVEKVAVCIMENNISPRKQNPKQPQKNQCSQQFGYEVFNCKFFHFDSLLFVSLSLLYHNPLKKSITFLESKKIFFYLD